MTVASADRKPAQLHKGVDIPFQRFDAAVYRRSNPGWASTRHRVSVCVAPKAAWSEWGDLLKDNEVTIGQDQRSLHIHCVREPLERLLCATPPHQPLEPRPTLLPHRAEITTV